ncbi:hypothetical protein [Gallaecimonas pentaromativorans]|uniref:hypothetical protein n=1 Tax=Gallaecimonas pentaromativorans TaxID=584787 RepID=UPI003A8D9AC3
MRMLMLVAAVLVLLALVRMLALGVGDKEESQAPLPQQTLKNVHRQLDDAMLQSQCLNAIQAHYGFQGMRIKKLADNRYQISDKGKSDILSCTLGPEGAIKLTEQNP